MKDILILMNVCYILLLILIYVIGKNNDGILLFIEWIIDDKLVKNM